MNLTEAQLKAVQSNHKLICCLSCAGSGKTTVLTERIKRLLADGVDPEAICAVTYTVSAAAEMKKRIGTEIGCCDTVHGLCWNLLRRHGHLIGFERATLEVLSEPESDKFIAEQCRILKYQGSMQELRRAMLGGIPSGERLTPLDLIVGRIYHTLRRDNRLTYDAVLVYGLKLLLAIRETHAAFALPFEHLLVDEAQDAADLDWSIYSAIPVANIFVVGDPRQSIFEWRRGNPNHITELAGRTDVEAHHLSENFRSGQEICDVANNLAATSRLNVYHMRSAVNAVTAPSRCDLACFHDADAEALAIANAIRMIKLQSAAVLLRTNALVADYARVFKELGLDTTVCTYHSAKAKEWDIVFLPALEEGIMPLASEDADECRRLLYVGVTRAKRMLLCSYASQRKLPWSYRPVHMIPSRYVEEMKLS